MQLTKSEIWALQLLAVTRRAIYSYPGNYTGKHNSCIRRLAEIGLCRLTNQFTDRNYRHEVYTALTNRAEVVAV